jgi:hypothetical protein
MLISNKSVKRFIVYSDIEVGVSKRFQNKLNFMVSINLHSELTKTAIAVKA